VFPECFRGPLKTLWRTTNCPSLVETNVLAGIHWHAMRWVCGRSQLVTGHKEAEFGEAKSSQNLPLHSKTALKPYKISAIRGVDSCQVQNHFLLSLGKLNVSKSNTQCCHSPVLSLPDSTFFWAWPGLLFKKIYIAVTYVHVAISKCKRNQKVQNQYLRSKDQTSILDWAEIVQGAWVVWRMLHPHESPLDVCLSLVN